MDPCVSNVIQLHIKKFASWIKVCKITYFFKTFNEKLITVHDGWAHSGVNRWAMEFFQSVYVWTWTKKFLVKFKTITLRLSVQPLDQPTGLLLLLLIEIRMPYIHAFIFSYTSLSFQIFQDFQMGMKNRTNWGVAVGQWVLISNYPLFFFLFFFFDRFLIILLASHYLK